MHHQSYPQHSFYAPLLNSGPSDRYSGHPPYVSGAPPGLAPHTGVVPFSLLTLDNGNQAMVVVDPLTRKLTIPIEHIVETKALMRQNIPSLCQLFLAGRCRQHHNCHQVHADPYAVELLRQQVQRLPVCCASHGDDDFVAAKAAGEASCYEYVRIPGLGRNEGLVPIRSFSWTQGLKQALAESHLADVQTRKACGTADAASSFRVVELSGRAISLCRLHIVDRCRFAEDCKFLHVCKELVAQDVSFLETTLQGRSGAAASAAFSAGQQQPHHHFPSGFSGAALRGVSAFMEGLHFNTSPPATPPLGAQRSVVLPPALSSMALLPLVEIGRVHTPPSPYGNLDAHCGTAEQSTTSSLLSASFSCASVTSTPGKRIRSDNSWSHDPYNASATNTPAPVNVTLLQ